MRRDGAEEAAPVEPVVLVEAAVLGGEECLPHVQRDRVERHVHAAHDRDAAEEAVAAVEDLASFAGPERADLAARRAAGEAAGRQPRVEQHDADAGERERSERTPLPAHPDARGLARGVEALAEHGDPILQTAGELGHEGNGGLQILVRVLRKQVSGRGDCEGQSPRLFSSHTPSHPLVTP